MRLTTAPPVEAVKGLPRITLPGKPAYITIAPDADLYELFLKIEETSATCFLLESLGEPGFRTRYSMIGFDPMHMVSARGNILFVDGTGFETTNPYYALRQMLPPETITRHYRGGLIGYLGYDAINYFEPSLSVQTHPDFDQFMLGVYTDGLIQDSQTGELLYFYYHKDRSAYVKRLLRGVAKKPRVTVEKLGNSLTKQEHAARVATAREHIKAGNIFQCEVGFKTKYRLKGNATAVYGRLRQVNPSPYMYYLKFGDKTLVGASPETLLELKEGALVTRPLAGTIRRGRTAAEDRTLAQTLLSNPKEIAEHNMLVDLHRNDIGRVAQFGSVRVSRLRDIRRFSHVQHIESEIVGMLRADEDMFSAVAANFPAGTLTGAPKIEAMKIINALESEPRGPYGGAVGYFGFNGDAVFAIAIRSLFAAGENAYAQTSGGIVHDSEPNAEYEEVRNKLAAMERALSL